jgi:hypothetical protein
MTPEEFVRQWADLKAELLESFVGAEGGTAVAKQIRAMNLSQAQQTQLREVINAVLRDTMYSLLLGLDGCASIGGVQQSYMITDENGIVITSGGDLEEEAWRQFQEGQ